MLISYKRLNDLLNSRGISLFQLSEKGVITNTAYRSINTGKYVNIEYIAKLCRYLDVPIEEVVEVVE